MNKYQIVSQYHEDGIDGFTTKGIFETYCEPDELEEEYRNWVVRWLKDMSRTGAGCKIRVLSAHVVEEVDATHLRSAIPRAIGMLQAEGRQKREAHYRSLEQQREQDEREQLAALKEKYPDAV